MLNILCMVCQAVPLIDLRNTLEENVLNAVGTSACSSTGGCWEWLPVQKVHKSVATVPENLPMSKIQIQREASSIDPNIVLETWGDDAPPSGRKVHQSSLATKQIGNRLSKKDVLMSRSWGAGGMPFSVLYMNPHSPRGNHASTAQQQELRKTESPTPSITHPNSRIALRNGSSTQSRRQYPIIPQLFISYGWGPFGK
ncbi:hypothetical protein WH47_10281 [Habropoda laboriosa]|uniref:Uncharacterized protein n=2 Tax=Habropoda laboriosa TaxID=597456 RepID=A0A0L7R4Q8_9HYME|nr:hypothetical protein WH47_10281 [Habropoda laboriosa]